MFYSIVPRRQSGCDFWTCEKMINSNEGQLRKMSQLPQSERPPQIGPNFVALLIEIRHLLTFTLEGNRLESWHLHRKTDRSAARTQRTLFLIGPFFDTVFSLKLVQYGPMRWLRMGMMSLNHLTIVERTGLNIGIYFEKHSVYENWLSFSSLHQYIILCWFYKSRMRSVNIRIRHSTVIAAEFKPGSVQAQAL